jgi:hypothetical protein
MDKIIKKVVETLQKMLLQSDLDIKLYGEAYWEISDRKIELLNPFDVKLNKGIYVVKNRAFKPIGKSIIEPSEVKDGI